MLQSSKQRFLQKTKSPNVDTVPRGGDDVIDLDSDFIVTVSAQDKGGTTVGNCRRNHLVATQHGYTSDDFISHRPACSRAQMPANGLDAKRFGHKMKNQGRIRA